MRADGIRGRWRALPRPARWALVVYVGGFLEGACYHALDLLRGGIHAYSGVGPLPVRVFFTALVALDPLVVVLTLRARPSALWAAGGVMTLDVLANRYVNWSWVTTDPGQLLRPVGLLPITLFGLFVAATVLPLRNAFTGAAPRHPGARCAG
ncbi:hypothetical protein [Streptomyces sp. NPDC001851]|uniref:hypothetical protein n=1 Tax=Streptomyces sp. NPDC001851 TaxID=3154529 RepID=UPI003325D7A8